MKPWRRLARETVIQDAWIKLHRDRVALADGHVLDPYWIFEEHSWVHVVAFDEEGRVPLVRQYRYASEVVSLEFPGGLLDPGEDPVAAARRELLEETGCEMGECHLVAAVFPNPARQNTRQHIVIGTGVRKVAGQNLDRTESIEIEFLPFTKIADRVRSGEFCNAQHIASYLFARLNLPRGVQA